MTALGRRDGATSIADLDEDIGRGRDDMRTPLNLRDLEAQGHVAQTEDGRWTLTPEGIAWLAEDDELSGGR